MKRHELSDNHSRDINSWYQNYGAELYRTLCKSLKDADLAQEISQEAFCKVAVRLSRRDISDVIENPRAFLYKVAFNEVYTKKKRERLENHLSDIFGDQSFEIKTEITPETIALDRQELSIVQNLIENLPSKQRQAFLMSRVDHKSHAEIANDLKVKKGTVKQHIVRVLAALKGQRKNERQKHDK